MRNCWKRETSITLKGRVRRIWDKHAKDRDGWISEQPLFNRRLVIIFINTPHIVPLLGEGLLLQSGQENLCSFPGFTISRYQNSGPSKSIQYINHENVTDGISLVFVTLIFVLINTQLCDNTYFFNEIPMIYYSLGIQEKVIWPIAR